MEGGANPLETSLHESARDFARVGLVRPIANLRAEREDSIEADVAGFGDCAESAGKLSAPGSESSGIGRIPFKR